MKLLNFLVMVFCMQISAEIIEFEEDFYCKNASKEVCLVAEEAAKIMGYQDNLEVIFAKASAIEYNPANMFLARGKNSFTKNDFVTINPTWFSKLTKDQQLFFMCENIGTLQNEIIPTEFKYLPLLFLMLEILLFLLLFYILGLTALGRYNHWLRIFICFSICLVSDFTVFAWLNQKIRMHFIAKNEAKIYSDLSKKLGKEAVISGLEQMQNDIKAELKKGVTFWATHVQYNDGKIKKLKEIL